MRPTSPGSDAQNFEIWLVQFDPNSDNLRGKERESELQVLSTSDSRNLLKLDGRRWAILGHGLSNQQVVTRHWSYTEVLIRKDDKRRDISCFCLNFSTFQTSLGDMDRTASELNTRRASKTQQIVRPRHLQRRHSSNFQDQNVFSFAVRSWILARGVVINESEIQDRQNEFCRGLRWDKEW